MRSNSSRWLLLSLSCVFGCAANIEAIPTDSSSTSSFTGGRTTVASTTTTGNGAPVATVDTTPAPSHSATFASNGQSSAVSDESDPEATSGVPSSQEKSTYLEPSASVATTEAATTRDVSSSAGAASESNTSHVEATPLKVYVAGDSTVSSYRDTDSTTDQAGWGQMLHEYLSELAVVDNRAVGGTTSRSFIDFGHFDALAVDLAAGDTLLVQFGTNDGNKTATYDLDGQEIPYYLDPATDYKTYLGKYVDLAQDKGVDLVFVTPPPRNSAYCTGGNGTGGHAQAMRELAAERGVVLADLNQRSVDYLKSICPAPTPEDFFALRPDGSVDGTHFQENGARLLARFVVEDVAVSSAPMSRYVIGVVD